MGFFDFLGRTSKEKQSVLEKTNYDLLNYSQTNGRRDNPVTVFSPTSFPEVEVIIDKFKEGKNTVVHLNKIKPDTAIRILDMLSGAIYALGGGVYEMDKNIFMFSPAGVEIQ